MSDPLHDPLIKSFTDKEDATIYDYAAEGRYASECAKFLGRTRNSIIGRAHRLGISFLGCGATGPKPIPSRDQNPIRVGQHEPWVNQNMSATVPVHHDRWLGKRW